MNLEYIEKIRVLGSSLNILYVEDEENIREEIATLLSHLFLNIDLAENGEEALEKYTHKEYDLILTDLNMPKLGGLELSKQILLTNPEQSIIIISAHKEVEQLAELIDIGVAGFILKPIDVQKLINKLYVRVKEIYANKMMKIHYEEMKKHIKIDTSSYDEIQKKDSLTSVYNYEYLCDYLSDKKEHAGILININDFKLINEYYSHNHANHLLFQVARILVQESKKYDFDTFRIGGDEFLLLCKYDTMDVESIKKTTNNIIKVIENTTFNMIGIKDINIQVRASYTLSSIRLLEELNIALEYTTKYNIKFSGYQECIAFNADIQNLIEMKKILKNAITNNLIIPVYQPILMLNNQVKYEVLMRIEQEDQSLMTPDKFLEISKRHHYYHEISEILIFKAIDEIEKSDKIFSINISYLDIANSTFVENLEKKLIATGIARRVIFEILESDVLEDMSIVDGFIRRFKKLGIKIAIDDFGSGYSNFSYIFKLEADFLKLDGSLVMSMLEDEKTYILVETIIEMSHKLGIEVIAEYVCNKEIYKALDKLGVDAMQGYYIGLPDRVIKETDKRR